MTGGSMTGSGSVQMEQQDGSEHKYEDIILPRKNTHQNFFWGLWS